MAILTGDIVGRGMAATAAGLMTAYTLVIPQKTVSNLDTLGKEAARWHQGAVRIMEMVGRGQLDRGVGPRAKFADEVLAAAAETVRRDACCVIFAQAYDGRVLGAMIYTIMTERQGSIHLLAIDPEHLAGTPGTAQLRGLGTALVAAVSRRFLEQGTETIIIHPLDQAAETFWRGRGFNYCGPNFCVRGRAAIEALIDGCQLQPDHGDGVVCGLPSMTEPMRVPAYRR